MEDSIEDSMEEEIPKMPQDLKNVLKISGYYNTELLRGITHEDMRQIEKFVQDDLINLVDESEYANYFGPYKNTPQNYKLLPGYIKLLQKISTSLNEKRKEDKSDTNIEENSRNNQVQLNRGLNKTKSKVTDKHDTIDLHKERKDLKKELVNKMKIIIGESNLDKKVKDDITAKLENIEVFVQIGHNEEMFGTVICIACSASIKLFYEARKSTCAPRWLRGNFYKHFRTHLETKSTNKKTFGVLNAETSRKKLRTIENYFKKPEEESEVFPDWNLPSVSGVVSKSNEKVVIHENILIKQRDKTDGNENKNKKTDTKSERVKRKLAIIPENQPFITEYFPYINEMEKIIEENTELKKQIFSNCAQLNILEGQKNCSAVTVSGLLQLLIKTASLNKNEIGRGNKYDASLKKFCSYLFIIGGRLLYETLYLNLNGALPSISTILREFSQNYTFEEGSPRINELKQYLLKRNFPKVIWLSEDATRINGRIQYNISTNTNVGFVLPFKTNGYLDNTAFQATSIQEIQRQFQEETRANYTYALVAQPLVEKSPPFCYCLFGSDNKFTADHVLRRWRTTLKMAEEQQIQVLGMSSDGDSRLLKVMKYITKLSSSQDVREWPWFHAELHPEIICVQDTTHIGTKLRTRLIKPGISLPFGDFVASVDHLKYIISHFSKDQHWLVETDIDSQDKMNFASVLKICNEKVLDLLKNDVPNSDATVLYLCIMRNVLDAFMKKQIRLENRLYQLWYSVFLLRIWRQWIKESDIYTLKHNFISLNSYTCIELNAHSMIVLIKKFTEENLPSDMFLPHLMSSQPCEQLFRATRSMTSTYSTMVNFSMLEILNRLKRIQYIQDIKNDLQGDFKFSKKTDTVDEEISCFYPLSDKEIETVVLQAQKDAVFTANKMGIKNSHESTLILDLKEVQKMGCDSIHGDEESDDDDTSDSGSIVREGEEISNVSNMNKLLEAFEKNEEDKHDNEEIDDHDTDLIQHLTPFKGTVNLKDYKEHMYKDGIAQSSNSPFLKVLLENGTVKTVKKTSLCWLFSDSISKVSTDRLERFKVKKKDSDPSKRIINIDKDEEISCKQTSSNEGDTSEDEISEETDLKDENPSKKSEIKILKEHYYSVMYEDAWYIGKVVKEVVTENRKKYIQIKFLKENLDNFSWPKQEDIQNVENIQVFYGPIKMLGSQPMRLSRADRVQINKLFKSLKKTK